MSQLNDLEYEYYTKAIAGTLPDSIQSQIVVRDASQLSGTLRSDVVYFIDGVVDMGSQSIEVPAGGLSLVGLTFDVSKLISSADNYTMFVSPVGGSGNIIGQNYAIEVTGDSSQVYNLTSATGFEAFEFANINYNDCSSLGEITNYRQGAESGTGRFGGQPSLTLSGTWSGGYFIDTSIVRGLVDGSYPLFKAGTGFTMASRFRSNQNIDLPANASFFDFSPSNFVNPSTVQITGAIVSRNGVFDATDSNYTPNLSASDLVSSWDNNNGMPNTFEGGTIGVTNEATNVMLTQYQFQNVSATAWGTLDLQHFDSPAGGQLRHLGNSPREYKITLSFTVRGIQGVDVALRIAKFEDSTSSIQEVLTQIRPINNLVGSTRDVAFFEMTANTELNQNDYVFIQIANYTGPSDLTVEEDSFFVVEAR